MNILENYTKTLNKSNKSLNTYRRINEDWGPGQGSQNHMTTASQTGMAGGGNPMVKDQQQDNHAMTGNSHVNNYLKNQKEKKVRDVMSQVDRVENGVDRINKVIEKLRKIIQELKHSYLQNEYPVSNPSGDGQIKQ